MSKRLQGAVALVTGASSGVGRATALELAEEGVSVVVTARRQERLDTVTRQIEQSGGKALSVAGDARDEETAHRAVNAAVTEFGTLDILINNAGAGNYKNLVDTSPADYDELMDSNMRSTFLFSRYAAPIMIKKGSGTIIMVSSIAGIYGFAGEAVYSATKFAQVGFAQALDKELQPHGIKVGVICPGGIKTEFAIGKGRTPEEVANSGMMEPDDVAQMIVVACTQSPQSRILSVTMIPMEENL
ncbi:MAG TPA: SDR family oxidoreductase [Chloroflexota bacterium]|nr:SDR family oxidoreductase [Chloroflexota bacterium]